MKNQRGITLIALVITIIVLLILAGVSIAMLTGDNGILTQATNAAEDTKQAEAVDRINMELNAMYATLLAGGSIDSAYMAGVTANLPATGYTIAYTGTTVDADDGSITITADIDGKTITGKIEGLNVGTAAISGGAIGTTVYSRVSAATALTAAVLPN